MTVACFKSHVKTLLDTASSVQQLGNWNFSTADNGSLKLSRKIMEKTYFKTWN